MADMQPQKRGPGRPRKSNGPASDTGRVTKEKVTETSKDKEVGAVIQQSSLCSDMADIQPQKRGPGRPRKSNDITGPASDTGRVTKEKVTESSKDKEVGAVIQQSSLCSDMADMQPQKRGPGRPRKSNGPASDTGGVPKEKERETSKEKEDVAALCADMAAIQLNKRGPGRPRGSKGKPDDSSEYLYHYCPDEAREGIEKDGRIHANEGAFGDGVYFAPIGPSASATKIKENNWDATAEWIPNSKIQNVIRVRKSQVGAKRVEAGNRKVYMAPHSVDLKRINHKIMKRK